MKYYKTYEQYILQEYEENVSSTSGSSGTQLVTMQSAPTENNTSSGVNYDIITKSTEKLNPTNINDEQKKSIEEIYNKIVGKEPSKDYKQMMLDIKSTLGGLSNDSTFGDKTKAKIIDKLK